MEFVNEKIKIIDEICKRHPSYGVEKGWSEYVGGMKDTGEWFFRKMIDVPQGELQSFLNDIIADEQKTTAQPAEQEQIDNKTWYRSPGGGIYSEHEKKAWENRHNQMMRKFFFNV